jgi:peptidoglycan-N-acetylglucosamine deacetylase
LLALLKERNAKATFFVLGANAKAYPDIIRQIAADGHTLGNHSYFHVEFHKMPLDAQMKEIRDTNALLQDITGQPCKLFRAPSGKLSAKLFRTLVGAKITYANWSRDTLDYSLDEQSVVAGLMKRPIQDRDIVLMHDDHQKAIGITDHILTQYKGFRFTGM